MAMIDGIQNKLATGRSLDILNSTSFDRTEYVLGSTSPNSINRDQLKASLDEDRDFLIQGEVFSDDLIDTLCQQLQHGFQS
jgi:hypothetical protein